MHCRDKEQKVILIISLKTVTEEAGERLSSLILWTHVKSMVAAGV